jgi:hypothetical protein
MSAENKTMQNEFIEKISSDLERSGYLTEQNPRVPGVQALVYARSSQRFRLGFAKVEDHFLFIEWGNSAFDRLDRLLEIYRCFSSFANQAFPLPHALRMQIPNLAIVAVSQTGFPNETAQFVCTHNLTPWYGGETGQIILAEIVKKQVIFQVKVKNRRSPRPGDFPLTHAAEIIKTVCQRAFFERDTEG